MIEMLGELPMTINEARESLTGQDKSLDAMADLILQRVARFFGECVQDESFCALGVDEKRDINGKLLYLRLVPCDDVGGTPARRIAKD